MVFEKFRKENSRLFKYIIDWLTFEIAKQESKLESWIGTRGFNKLAVSFRIERALKEGTTREIRERSRLKE